MNDPLYDRLRADLEEERGTRAWLRSRSTRSRAAAITVASLASSVGLALVMAGPARLASHGALYWAGVVTMLATLGLAMAAMLRPIYLPAWSGGAKRLLVAGIGLASLASIVMTSDGSLGALASGGRCLVIGVSIGAPIFGLALLLDRQPRRVGVFRALFSGLVGVLAVQLVCPATGLVHLVVEHFGLALGGAAGFVGVGAALERFSRTALPRIPDRRTRGRSAEKL